MTDTISIRKLHLAIAVLAVAVVAPSTAAVATHVFDDVAEDRFYSDAVEWALANDITTGTGPTTFEPDRGVTRGENITFAKRYDDNIVQPAVTELSAAQPFAITTFENGAIGLTDTPATYVTVSVTAAVDGHVTVNSTALAQHQADGGGVYCMIAESTGIPGLITVAAESAQVHETAGFANYGSLSGTRMFAIDAGTTVDYVLACEETTDGGGVIARNLTAIFTPAT